MELCALASGSSGNCIYIGHGSTHILVDAGISGKKICEGVSGLGLEMADITALLITHDHSDHIQSASLLANRYRIPVYATKGTIAHINRVSSKPLPAEQVHFIRADEAFNLGELKIDPFRISHDAIDPVSFSISADNKKIGFATDLGEFDNYIVSKLSNSDALYIEANHDVNMLMVGPYTYSLKQRIRSPLGHLSNDDTARLILSVQNEHLRNIVLAHLSKENNFEELAARTVEAAISDGWEYDTLPAVCVAKRTQLSDKIIV